MTYFDQGLYVEPEKLRDFGRNTARLFKYSGTAGGKKTAREAAIVLARLREARDALEKRYLNSQRVPPAAQWLLDNWYLAAREGQSAAGEFRRAGRLRSSGEGALCVFTAAALIRSGLGRVSEGRAELFLEGFQLFLPLTREELSLMVPAMKIALIYALEPLGRDLAEGREVEAERMEAVFDSLRLLATLDLSPMLTRADLAERVLRRDPAGAYPDMDERTRDLYRREVTRLAKKQGREEKQIAADILKLAEAGRGPERHVGWWLFEKPMGKEKKRSYGGWYIAVNLLAPHIITALIYIFTGSAIAALLALVPATELIKSLLDYAVLRIVPPRLTPRMALLGGVPEEGRTVCAVSCLLSSPEDGPAAAKRLEEYMLANRDCGKNLLFAILADLPEAGERFTSADEPAMAAAARAIMELNKRHGGGFLFLCRRRSWNERDGIWTGRERKRGAILALARLMLGAGSEMLVLSGDEKSLRGAKFILALDSDTRLLPGAARELIGAALHPLNAPVIDEEKNVVISGHALIHPRLSVGLHDARRTDFTRLFAGLGGIDPYGSASGEVYMDLFSSGGFTGKGVISALALVRCTEGLPANLILSHDAVEGAILRGAYMSDTELTEGFPAAPMSYFRRMERWVRGDWQNVVFLGKRGRAFAPIDRWRLFDSLRRSLLPAFALAAMVTAFFVKSAAWAGYTALASLCVPLITALLSDLPRPGERRARCRSTAIYGVPGAILTSMVRLILLPFEAFICLRAALTALYRLFVTRRGLLSWETAAQSEARRKKGAVAYISAMWPAMVAGGAALILSPAVIGKAAGLLWLLSPLAAASLAREPKKAPPMPEADRSYLIARAKEIWSYFETFCVSKTGYLPPDNWQEQPPIGAAWRTSPTNIGLALLSALSAADLGIGDADKCWRLIDTLLRTVEGLPKWHGHLYNWYDIRAKRVLEPRYISTVDSGNLAACLAALRSAAMDAGRGGVAERAQRLYEEMDFAPLYDSSRRLFRTGYDVSAALPSKSWYDLMASEARLAGFVAIAKGDVPRRHWRALSRAELARHGRRGMASWTGTMFEYLMPRLLLPAPEGSFMGESIDYCLFIQRRRVPKNVPWGISESAFFSLDASLSYRYKAHGCAGLALKRGMDEELVVSPYSAYLALAAAPRAAVKNLRAIEKLSPPGRFGLWEAIDFTPSRCRLPKGETVRCCMAHHLGMSLVAINNAVNGDVMTRRFMSDPAMAAHAPLLEEKPPVSAVVLRRRDFLPVEKPSRQGAEGWEIKGGDVSWQSPLCALLSNGAYSLALTDSGLSRARAGGIEIYSAPRSPFSRRGGLELYLISSGERIDLLPLPGREGKLDFTHTFTGESALFTGASDTLSTQCAVSVSARDTAEARLVTINTTAPLSGRLILEFDPALAPARDYYEHPAFWRLGLDSELREGALILRRLPRFSMAPASLALACSESVAVAANDSGESAGWLSHPRVRAAVKVELPTGGSFSVRFALAFGADGNEAYSAAQRALAMGPADYSTLPCAVSALYGLSPREGAAAMDLLGALLFPKAAGEAKDGPDGLWRIGVSGENPVICAELSDEEQLPAAGTLIRKQALLRACGVKTDLVFLTLEGGDYQRVLTRSVTDTLTRLGLEGFFCRPGGVYMAERDRGEAAMRSAALTVSLTSMETARERTSGKPLALPPARRSGGDVEYRFEENGVFEFFTSRRLPRRVWGNLLTNGSFGYFAADCGCGSMWYQNAREGRINPWLNDPRAASGPETLEMEFSGGRCSLFAAEDNRDCRTVFGFGWASWERTVGPDVIKTVAFVPPEIPCRVLIITGAKGRVRWKTSLTLSGAERDSRYVITEADEKCLRAKSGWWRYKDAPFAALFSTEPDGFTCDEAAWLSGEVNGKCGAGLYPCFGAVLPAAEDIVIVCGCGDEEEMRPLADAEAAWRAFEETREYWAARLGGLRVKTPEPAMDRYLNGWAPYQLIAGRLLGRTSLYQSGGAWGFRDQLQDAVNLILLESGPARRQIVECCRHQYREGDVMHWWHSLPEGDMGVRTRCSDDLLWLPWAVCEYVEKTGDSAMCTESAPWLSSPPLSEDERSRYEKAEPGRERSDVLTHALAALNLVLERGEGAHGLLLMGGGDWNDAMDEVGSEGRGESVWLTFFFVHTARRFAELMKRLGRSNGAAELLSAAERLGRAADEAWDGAWYLRGWYDDGRPQGSNLSLACQLDSITQSWSALCPEASPERSREGVDSAYQRLYDPGARLCALFDPPYSEGCERAGYIVSYGPGFRENGGQYTHGAVWLAMGLFRRGMPERGVEILKACLPRGGVYGAEPFILAADVYMNADRNGEAGWSWYTGSAGWFFRVATEELLGLRLRGGRLTLSPSLPPDWPGYEAVWTDRAGNPRRVVADKSGATLDGGQIHK